MIDFSDFLGQPADALEKRVNPFLNYLCHQRRDKEPCVRAVPMKDFDSLPKS